MDDAGASAARDGVLLRAKPAGVTSHDVVDEVRRSLGRGLPRRERPKVGHAGTLDPFATGLLLVLVGRATRAQRYLMELPKTYRAVARLGWTSDTGDRDGELVETGRMPESLSIPVGEQLQTPPAYSAVKVGGRRAYELARAGETPELAARPVTVYRAELLWHEGERAAFEIECSSGTYVRSLVTDLGDAYCEELRRTAIGPFRLEHAAGEPRGGGEGGPGTPDRVMHGQIASDPPDAIVPARDGFVPLRDALAFMPERALSAEEARDVAHGRRVPVARGSAAVADHAADHAEAPTRLTLDGEIVAIGEPRDGELQPVVVFAPA
jgi:tRNA pseudouridine55 synthase